MGLMRVNRPIIPYFYEVNKINKQEWEWTGVSKGTPREDLFHSWFDLDPVKSKVKM